MDKRYRLLIFDWDGTLMDSEARIVTCIQAACRDLDMPVPDHDAVCNIIGLGLREAIDTLFPGTAPDFHAAMAERYRYYFMVADDTPSTLFAGVEEMLAELEGAGHMLAVATGKGRQGLDMALTETGLAGRFHATRCADETRSKPHPQMLHELLEFTGVEPHEAVMVGDTEYDMQMAANAGMDGLAVSYGVHALERLTTAGALAAVHDINGMHAWLAGRRYTRDSA